MGISVELQNLGRAFRRLIICFWGADQEIRAAFEEGFKMGQEHRGHRAMPDGRVEPIPLWRNHDAAWEASDISEVVDGPRVR